MDTSGKDELREAVDKIVVSMIRTFTPDDLLIPLAEGESYTSYDRDSAVNTILALIAASNQQAVQKAEASITKLQTDLGAAMGHMEGCGHPYKYLIEHYPDLAELAAAQPRKDGDETP